MSEIVWLASYPKSGNTWLRVFLSNFLRPNAVPADINELEFGVGAHDRALFDSALGVESADLTEEEIECHRPAAFRYLAARSDETLFLKTHDAYRSTFRGEPLIPADVTRGAIYLTRNPLDVAVSFAHHSGKTLEDAIGSLALETLTTADSLVELKLHLKQILLSWSRHVSSWLDQSAVPVHVMRYEDMSHRPLETFCAAMRFLDLPEDVGRVRRAIDLSSFDILQQQEQARGFKERSVTSFFRQGRTDAWRGVLTQEQVERVINDHRPVMQRLGYLSESGCVIEAER